MTRIKELRISQKYNQKEFANILNVTQATVSRWETGNMLPDIEQLAKISDLFNVTIGYILGKEDKKEESTNEIETSPSDENIKFALFNGDKEITDEMYEEVKQFAQFVKNREKNKNK